MLYNEFVGFSKIQALHCGIEEELVDYPYAPSVPRGRSTLNVDLYFFIVLIYVSNNTLR